MIELYEILYGIVILFGKLSGLRFQDLINANQPSAAKRTVYTEQAELAFPLMLGALNEKIPRVPPQRSARFFDRSPACCRDRRNSERILEKNIKKSYTADTIFRGILPGEPVALAV